MPTYAKAITVETPAYCGYVQTAAAGTAPDAFIFVADGHYEVDEVHGVWDVVGGAGAAADVKKVPSGTALASGSTVLASTFDLTTGARAKVSKTSANGGLTATQANRRLAPGDTLAVDTSGTLTGLVGLNITVRLKRTRPL